MAVGISAHRDVHRRREYLVSFFAPSGDVVSLPHTPPTLVVPPSWIAADQVSARLVAAYVAEHPAAALAVLVESSFVLGDDILFTDNPPLGERLPLADASAVCPSLLLTPPVSRPPSFSPGGDV